MKHEVFKIGYCERIVIIMESIIFVSTPRCSECKTPMALKGRYCCLGCERQRKIVDTYKPLPKKRQLSEKELETRNKTIMEMREIGFSYSKIAAELKIPRATVQSAVTAVLKRRGHSCSSVDFK